MLFDVLVPAPFGAIGARLTSDQQRLLELVYLPQGKAWKGSSPLTQRIFAQVSAYLHNPSTDFDLPLIKQGTDFQNRVWQEISRIPAGHTLNYKTVGQLIDCGSPRAVGGACGANPYPLIVPCHRVVATGGIGGFAKHDDGFHIAVKRWLLAHEGVVY